MSIYKTASGSYRVQVIVGRDAVTGKYIRKGTTHKLKREAVEEERRLLALGDDSRVSQVTFGEFVQDIFLPAKKNTVRYSTYRTYNDRLRVSILPHLSDMVMSTISKDDVQRVILNQPSYANAKHVRALLSTVFGFAVDSGTIAVSPAEGKMRMPQLLRTVRSSGEVVSNFSMHRKIYDTVRGTEPTEMAILLCLGFGLRKGEMLAVTKADIGKQEIYINKTYVRGYGSHEYKILPPKTAKANRTIPAMPFVIERIHELSKDLSDNIPLVNRNGKHVKPDRIAIYIKEFAASNDLPAITCQSMRHSFATAHIRAGTPVADVSLMLGHENITTTFNSYVRPTLKDARESALKANELLSLH